MKFFQSIAMVGLTLISLQTQAAAVQKGAKAVLKCDLNIEATDQMQYQVDGKKLESITIPAKCPHFTVNLKHGGKLPKQVMGHNFVLTASKDASDVYNEAVRLGPDKDYLPNRNAAPFKGKVLAAGDRLLAGGESEVIKIQSSALKKGGDYTFFCTFPGHFGMMQGKLSVN